MALSIVGSAPDPTQWSPFLFHPFSITATAILNSFFSPNNMASSHTCNICCKVFVRKANLNRHHSGCRSRRNATILMALTYNARESYDEVPSSSSPFVPPSPPSSPGFFPPSPLSAPSPLSGVPPSPPLPDSPCSVESESGDGATGRPFFADAAQMYYPLKFKADAFLYKLLCNVTVSEWVVKEVLSFLRECGVPVSAFKFIKEAGDKAFSMPKFILQPGVEMILPGDYIQRYALPSYLILFSVLLPFQIPFFC